MTFTEGLVNQLFETFRINVCISASGSAFPKNSKISSATSAGLEDSELRRGDGGGMEQVVLRMGLVVREAGHGRGRGVTSRLHGVLLPEKGGLYSEEAVELNASLSESIPLRFEHSKPVVAGPFLTSHLAVPLCGPLHSDSPHFKSTVRNIF